MLVLGVQQSEDTMSYQNSELSLSAYPFLLRILNLCDMVK